MSHRTNQRDQIGQRRKSSKMFADLHSRNSRVNGRKVTADFPRSLRLQIECVQLAGTTPHEQQQTTRGGTKTDGTAPTTGRSLYHLTGSGTAE
jgi:hypothetical protein